MTLSRVTITAVAVFALGGGGLGLTALTAVGETAPARMPVCATSGPIPDLSVVQAQNARIVTATAERGGHQAALVALMTAMAESDLRVLANPNDPSGSAFPNQGTGHDHDSLGLFQQRPSWGSAAHRISVSESTNLFVDSLLAIPNWADQPPWRAAQLVQRSAFDGRPRPANGGSTIVGENYLRQSDRANRVLAEIEADATTMDCGGAGPMAAGDAAPHGLPDHFAIPAGTSPAAVTAVTFALAQLGKPYLWGGTGPDRFDCSGLTQAAWQRAGIPLGRTTWDQLNDGTPTTLAALLPGDLVLTPGSDGTLAAPGHMGMYLGNGLVVHAPRTGDVVKVTALDSFIRNGVSGLRHVG
jgi:cell wall-associated NlpC family hydrolase